MSILPGLCLWVDLNITYRLEIRNKTSLLKLLNDSSLIPLAQSGFKHFQYLEKYIFADNALLLVIDSVEGLLHPLLDFILKLL